MDDGKWMADVLSNSLVHAHLKEKGLGMPEPLPALSHLA